MNTVVVELNPPTPHLGYKSLVLNADERMIVDQLHADPHAVNNLLQSKTLQASRKNGAFDLRTFEQLGDEVKRILAHNRERSNKMSPANVVIELRQAFERHTGRSIL